MKTKGTNGDCRQTVTFDHETSVRLKVYCALSGKTQTEVINAAVLALLDKSGVKMPKALPADEVA
jgi:hypothetical protein